MPLVATNDVYFKASSMHLAHDALLCIADGAFIGQDERRRVTAEHWFKPAADMRALFADLPEACDNTLDIARRCAFTVPKRDPILPRFPTEGGRSENDELAHQAREGLKARLAINGAAQPLEVYEDAPGERDRGHHLDGLRRLLPDRLGLHEMGGGAWRAGGPGPRLRARARWSPGR